MTHKASDTEAQAAILREQLKKYPTELVEQAVNRMIWREAKKSGKMNKYKGNGEKR